MRHSRKITGIFVSTFVAVFVATGITPANAAETFTPVQTSLDSVVAGNECAISDDGRWVASTNGGTTYLDDVSTGARIELDPTSSATGIVNRVRMSSDGRFLAFTYIALPTGYQYGEHLYFYDRQSGVTQTLTAEPMTISDFDMSRDGRTLVWSQQTPPVNANGPGVKSTWAWNSATNNRYDITQNEAGASSSAPLPSPVLPQIYKRSNGGGGGRFVHNRLTGANQPITYPEGAQWGDPIAVSMSGNRLLYFVYTADGPRLIVTSLNGTIIDELTVRSGTEYFEPVAFFSDDGNRVLVNTARDATSGAAEFSTFNYIWDLRSDSVRIINVPNIGILGSFGEGELGGFCGLSTDLRWAVASVHISQDQVDVVRMDLDSIAPTPVNPSSLAGNQLSDQINRLYAAYFLRTPEAPGLNYWRTLRATGTSLASVSAEFAASPEFTNRYGTLNNRAFVKLIYQNVLGRAPETEGWNYWTGILDSGASRGTVMLGFSEATENIAATGTSNPVADARIAQLDRVYLAFFKRHGDAGGLTYWYDLIKKGASLADAATEFSTSAEFQAVYGNLNDAAFVDLVYQNVLGRPAEAEGRAFWIAALAKGNSRGVIMTSFSESVEFILKTDSIPPQG